MVSAPRLRIEEINMSSTLEHTVSRTLAGPSFAAGTPDFTFGAVLRKSFAFARDVLVDTSPYEVIEGGALLAVLAATAVFTLGAFGVHIGAN